MSLIMVTPRVIEIRPTTSGRLVPAAPAGAGEERASQRDLVVESLLRCPSRRAAKGKRN